MVGRRERNRQRTHDALRDAALARFETQGYEATTIEQIADDADVSARTFFRYFPCKEALLFGEEYWEPLLAAFAARPRDEPLLVSVRELGTVMWQAGVGAGEPRRALRARLMRTHPGVAAYARERVAGAQPRIAELAATRLGVDPGVDLRPLVFAQLWSALTVYTLEYGRLGPDPVSLFDEWAVALGSIVEQLTGDEVVPSR